MFFISLLLALSVSIDALGIGITYGIKKTSMSKISIIILFIMSFIASYISIYAGQLISLIFSPFISNIIGFFILFIIGLCIIFSKPNNSYDFDNSNDINWFEGIYLSFALSLDIISVGIGASSGGSIPTLYPILTSISQVLFIYLGVFIGKYLSKKIKLPDKFYNFLSGIILIIIAISRLL